MTAANTSNFPPEKYITIASNHLVVYAIFSLQNDGDEISAEDIISACFMLFPKKFSLRTYPQWPDSALVGRRLHDCEKNGWLTARIDTGFKLTALGNRLAEKVARELGIEIPKKEKPVGKVGVDKLQVAEMVGPVPVAKPVTVEPKAQAQKQVDEEKPANKLQVTETAEPAPVRTKRVEEVMVPVVEVPKLVEMVVAPVAKVAAAEAPKPVEKKAATPVTKPVPAKVKPVKKAKVPAAKASKPAEKKAIVPVVKPAVAKPKPAKKTKPRTIEAPKPVEKKTAAKVVKPSPAKPKPVKKEKVPAVTAPKPAEKKFAAPVAKPAAVKPTPVKKAKAPVVKVPKPVEKKAAATVAKPAPVKVKPTEKAKVPVTKAPKPVEKKITATKVKPVSAKPKPAEKAKAPIVKMPKPVEKKAAAPVVKPEPVKPKVKKAKEKQVVEAVKPAPIAKPKPTPKPESKATVVAVQKPLFQIPTVSAEEKAKAGKYVKMMEGSDAYRLYKKNGANANIGEFDFRSLLLCTMESSHETLARNVELFKGYAGIHNRQDLTAFLGFCAEKFAHLLVPEKKAVRKYK